MFKNIFKKRYENEERDDHILSETDSFMQIEALRHIKTNVIYSVPKKDDGSANIIAVTSASSFDGKSTMTTNVSVVFAQSGNKVLLIDCDLRRPRINKFFKLKNDTGVSNYLCGRAELGSIVKKTDYDNLDIISCGMLAPNPNELLSLPKFGDMLSKLAKEYDYIFIDTPPLDSVSDCLVIAPNTDGVIVVARHLKTSYPLLSNAVRQLEFIKVKILGFVMTDYKSPSYNKNKKYKNAYYSAQNNQSEG